MTKGQALERKINSIMLLNTHLYFCSTDVYWWDRNQNWQSSWFQQYIIPKLWLTNMEKSLNASQDLSAGHQKSQNCCKVVSRRIKWQETVGTLAFKINFKFGFWNIYTKGYSYSSTNACFFQNKSLQKKQALPLCPPHTKSYCSLIQKQSKWFAGINF